MLRLPLWEDLPYFNQVVLRGSLRQAAIDLKVSPATVSRRLRSLEERIGTSLFFRKSNQMELTKAGIHLYTKSRDINRIINDIRDVVIDNNGVEINLTSIPSFATYLLLPNLEKFRKQIKQPINFVIDTNSNVQELNQDPFDIAIRLSRPESGRYKVRKLWDFSISLVRSRELEIDTLETKPLVLWGSVKNKDSQFNDLLRTTYPNNRAAIYVENHHMYLEALKCNIGIGILPKFILNKIDDKIIAYDEGHDNILPNQDIWLVIREDALKHDIIRQFVDFLSELKINS